MAQGKVSAQSFWITSATRARSSLCALMAPSMDVTHIPVLLPCLLRRTPTASTIWTNPTPKSAWSSQSSRDRSHSDFDTDLEDGPFGVGPDEALAFGTIQDREPALRRLAEINFDDSFDLPKGERYADTFDPRFSRSPCRWMWSDAEGTPFCWSRVRSAETTFKKLQRYKHCAKQVKLEIHGETKSEVVAFASVAAVLSYLGGNAIDPANGPDTSTVKAAEDDVESIQWMWG